LYLWIRKETESNNKLLTLLKNVIYIILVAVSSSCSQHEPTPDTELEMVDTEMAEIIGPPEHENISRQDSIELLKRRRFHACPSEYGKPLLALLIKYDAGNTVWFPGFSHFMAKQEFI
jgi:hypothetical protein